MTRLVDRLAADIAEAKHKIEEARQASRSSLDTRTATEVQRGRDFVSDHLWAVVVDGMEKAAAHGQSYYTYTLVTSSVNTALNWYELGVVDQLFKLANSHGLIARRVERFQDNYSYRYLAAVDITFCWGQL